MSKLIGNEVKYAQSHLKNKTVENNAFKTVVILIKYFFKYEGMTNTEIKLAIQKHLEESGKGNLFDEEVINRLISTNANDKVTLNQLESITITKSEWNTIQELGKTEQYKKVLFTLLCWYKIKVGIGYSADGMIKVDYSHLNQGAHVSLTSAKRNDMLAYFMEVGLVDSDLGAISKKLHLFYMNEESEPLLVITEFDRLDFYYKFLKNRIGQKIVQCQCCGELFVANAKTNPKYCSDECKKKMASISKMKHKNKQDK